MIKKNPFQNNNGNGKDKGKKEELLNSNNDDKIASINFNIDDSDDLLI